MLYNLEKERIMCGLSITTLASKLGVSSTVLKKWICCSEPIPAGKLRLMYEIFGGKSLEYLLIKK